MNFAKMAFARVGPHIWNFAAAGVGQGATLLLTISLAKALDPHDFGSFSVVSGTVLTISALAQLGLAFTATNFVARYLKTNPPQAQLFASVCTFFAVALGIVAGGLTSIASSLIAKYAYGDSSLIFFLVLAGIGVPFAALVLVQNAILTGLQQFRALATNAALFAIALGGATFFGFITAGAFGAAIGYVAAMAIRACHGSLIMRRYVSGFNPLRLPAVERGMANELIVFAVPVAISTLTCTPAIWITNAWLVNSQGLHQFGLFAVAFTIKTVIVFIPVQIGAVLLPQYVMLTETNPGAAEGYLLKRMAVIGIFTVMVAAIFWFGASNILSVLGSKYLAASSIVQWLMIAVVAESIATLGSYHFAGQRTMWRSLLLYAFPKDVVLIIAGIVLVPTQGGIGLAMAHCISWGYGLLVILGLMARRWAMPGPRP